jgi:tryptophanyl-tRNA synthetase
VREPAGNALEIGASEDETRKWVAAMVTDQSRIYKRDPGHPEICNVFSFHKFFSQGETDSIAQRCRGAEIGCVECKKNLAEALNNYLRDVRARRVEFAGQPELVNKILEEGAERARLIARPTLREVKEKMGLI